MAASKKGRVLARCKECGAEAIADGTGKPVTLEHKENCSQ